VRLIAGPFWIKGVEPGKLAIVPRPRGGDWLEHEVHSWTRSGLDVIVSLLTPEEQVELDLEDEAAQSRAFGLEFNAFPIPDRGVPPSRADALRFFAVLMDRLATGKAVGIHCRQGIGRSALVAASLLALSGIPPGVAFDRIGEARGSTVPETREQRRWVENVAALEAPVIACQNGSLESARPLAMHCRGRRPARRGAAAERRVIRALGCRSGNSSWDRPRRDRDDGEDPRGI
jgi:protein-tyrosine phosphatase